MSESRFIIHAPNVHNGGGSVLLRCLLSAVPEGTTLIVDTRMTLSAADTARLDKVYRVKPTVWCRLVAELRLRQLAGYGDTVLCFGNLPPLFGVKGVAKLFLQNRYLVDSCGFGGLPIKVRLRLMAERLWLRMAVRHANQVVVQTPTMQKLFEEKFFREAWVFPFAAEEVLSTVRDSGKSIIGPHDFDFIYVASGAYHKNHRNLLKAWVILAEKGVMPTLCLTIDPIRHSALCEWVEQLREKYSLNIHNIPSSDFAGIYNHCLRSRALIYPSKLESFGLPLIEANSIGMPILASELDYVRDLVDPIESFDPHSALSIARAVMRFLGEKHDSIQLLDATTFLDKILVGDGLS